MAARSVNGEPIAAGRPRTSVPAPRDSGDGRVPNLLIPYPITARSAVREKRAGASVYSAGLAVLDVLSMGGVVSAYRDSWIVLVCAVSMIVIFNASAGLYERRLAPSVFSAIPALCAGGPTALCVALVVEATTRAGEFSLAELKTLPAIFGLFLTLSCVGRCAYFAIMREIRRKVGRGERALVIGTGETADRISSVLKEHPEYGLDPLGFIALTEDVPQIPLHLPILGQLQDTAQVMTAHRIETVVAPMEESQGHLDAVIRTCADLGCRVIVAPSSCATRLIGPTRIEYLHGIPTAELRSHSPGRLCRSLKRGLDLSLATCALVFSLPVFVACVFLVRLEGGPGVIFRQRRVGLNGRPFVLFKFRTLKPVDAEEANTRWSIENDERLGPIGHFLRATSLDELPQLWNVVRGEMSLVGPRPERPYFVRCFSEQIPAYSLRHRVLPGLTGWAQVHGLRGDTSIQERVRLDNHYIENWSVFGDVRILVMTLRTLLPKKRR